LREIPGSFAEKQRLILDLVLDVIGIAMLGRLRYRRPALLTARLEGTIDGHRRIDRPPARIVLGKFRNFGQRCDPAIVIGTFALVGGMPCRYLGTGQRYALEYIGQPYGEATCGTVGVSILPPVRDYQGQARRADPPAYDLLSL